MDNNRNLSWKKNVEFHMKKIVFRKWKILLLCDLSLQERRHLTGSNDGSSIFHREKG